MRAKDRRGRDILNPRGRKVEAMITYSMMYEIDKYRARHNSPTISTAIYELLEKGLKNEE